MFLLLWNYLTPVCIFGVSIAIDVAIVTISRFKHQGLTFVNWPLSLAFTHIVLPAFSYFLFFEASAISPHVRSVLGVVGFVFITGVIGESFFEALGLEMKYGLSHSLSHLFRIDRSQTRHFAIVLSVSWDALLCGPGLLPLAQKGSWSIAMMIGAFLIFGFIVGSVGVCSLYFAKKLRERNFSNVKELATFNLVGTFFELAVIGGFGINSLWSAFSEDSNVYWSIVMAAVGLSLVFFVFRQRLFQNELAEAAEAIGG